MRETLNGENSKNKRTRNYNFIIAACFWLNIIHEVIDGKLSHMEKEGKDE